MKILLRPWLHFADFNGRSSRTEYFLFILSFYGLAVLAIFATDAFSRHGGGTSYPIVALMIFAVLAIIPSLAIQVRRLHDQGKSGANVFLTMIPLIGWVFAAMFAFTPGDDHENAYGPNPRNPTPEFLAEEVFS